MRDYLAAALAVASVAQGAAPAIDYLSAAAAARAAEHKRTEAALLGALKPSANRRDFLAMAGLDEDEFGEKQRPLLACTVEVTTPELLRRDCSVAWGAK